MSAFPFFLQVNVSTEKQTDEARAVKEIMRLKGMAVIQQQVAKYITDLKQGTPCPLSVFKPAVGVQALHDILCSAARASSLLISAFLAHSTSCPPKPLQRKHCKMFGL